MITNVSFYRFVAVDEPDELALRVRGKCEELDLRGKVVVAPEGMNGMLAGVTADVDAWEAWVRGDPRFDAMSLKRSTCEDPPYPKLTVKVKPEIVTMRTDGVDAVHRTGRYLPPERFRDWLREGRSMKVVDVRNDYEVRVGTFRGAIDPGTEYFHQFPEWVLEHREELQSADVVVTYCTGGIRCEKATSWMLEQGFDNVWQLEGGVHEYFERIDDADVDWDGELFVFDRRIAVDTSLRETDTELCERCGDPIVERARRVCGCPAE